MGKNTISTALYKLAKSEADRGKQVAKEAAESVASKKAESIAARKTAASAKRAKLADDTASRMARAAEQGMMVNMPLYHGTIGDVPGFDLNMGGKVSRSRVGTLGVSASTDPETATEFANLAAARQGDNSSANVMKLFHRSDKPARIDLDGSETNEEIFATVLDAWDSGYNSILFTNYTTPSGKAGQSFVLVKEPNQLRSVNAMFDPAKKDSSNLLAGLGGAAVVGAGLAPDEAEASPELLAATPSATAAGTELFNSAAEFYTSRAGKQRFWDDQKEKVRALAESAASATIDFGMSTFAELMQNPMNAYAVSRIPDVLRQLEKPVQGIAGLATLAATGDPNQAANVAQMPQEEIADKAGGMVVDDMAQRGRALAPIAGTAVNAVINMAGI